jgi:hypothetical protein
MPYLRNSQTIRGDPQPTLASDILRINALISFDTGGLPGLPCLLNVAHMIAKALTLPGNHSPRLDKNQSIPPPRPAACDPRPEHTVPGINSWALGCSLIHSELMSQRDDLEL